MPSANPINSGSARSRGSAIAAIRGLGRAAKPEPGAPDPGRAQLRAYADDVRKSYVRELRRSRELEETYLATVKVLAAAVEAKDEYTGGHIQRVHDLGLLLADVMLTGERDPQFAYGLLLHDIGKLAVPDAVLNKPGPLDDEEWRQVRQHPTQGVRILSGVPFLGGALDVVRHHHERWDGSGYPAGLRGEQIPLWARMFAVVDTVDAVTSDRPYREARPLEAAIDELRQAAGSQFDPACVAAFEQLERRAVKNVLQHPRVSVIDPASALAGRTA